MVMGWTINLLYYAAVTDGIGERLQRAVEVWVLQGHTETCRTLDGLSRKLRELKPGDNLAIAVLVAANKEDLMDILCDPLF